MFSTWGAFEVIVTVGVIATILGTWIAWRASRRSAPRQSAGDRGVNVGGDNSGTINTGSQSKRRDP